VWGTVVYLKEDAQNFMNVRAVQQPRVLEDKKGERILIVKGGEETFEDSRREVKAKNEMDTTGKKRDLHQCRSNKRVGEELYFARK